MYGFRCPGLRRSDCNPDFIKYQGDSNGHDKAQGYFSKSLLWDYIELLFA